MPERTRGGRTSVIKPAVRLPRSGLPRFDDSGDGRRAPYVVQRGEEDVVLLGAADGDPDALPGEGPGDDGAGLQRCGQTCGLLAHGQPHEVGLAVRDVEPAV